MRNVRWLVVGLALGLVVSLAPSCGAGMCGPDNCTGRCDSSDRCVGLEPAKCDPTTCSGCCDASGTCVSGSQQAQCGSAGAACRACDAALTCTAGACVAANGGTDGGTDAGSSLPFPTNPLVFTVTITPNPPRLGTNSLKVLVTGSNGTPVPDATLTAKTWMPAMGHGSATPTVSNKGGGEYTVSGVSFTMYGDWEVALTAKAANGILAGSKTFAFSVN